MTPGCVPIGRRAQVRVEAQDRCGYCQTQQALAYGPLEVEHIIPTAAGGSDDIDNLWLACRPCNQHKAAQTHSYDPRTGRKVRLFDSRRQHWKRHFLWSADGTLIIGRTVCGRATVEALRLNNPFAVETRRLWVQVGWHPPLS